MEVWPTNPFEKTVLVRGQGCRVWDAAGRSYLDLTSGTWCNVLGHAHPRLTDVIREQTSQLVHVGSPFVGDEIRDACSKLAEILPPKLNRAVFLNTGSEAVELALKIARAATIADGVAVVERSYYGATAYALKLSEMGRNVPYLPSVGEVVRVPAPECRRCPVGASWPCGNFPCLDPLSELAEKNDKSIAAVLYEPVLANGGVIVPPRGYGSRLRVLASRCGALFVADEVTTGVGRTGRWFGCEHDDIVPDIVVIGKAIGAGFPVSVVVTSDEVEARCRGALTHVQSHQNDPFSGRITATVISILQDERLVERAGERGTYLLHGLKEFQSRHPCVTEVRGRGFLVGIELLREQADHGTEVARQLLESGFIVNYQPHNAAFRLFPPYIISTREIDSFLQAFDQALSAVTM